MDENNNYSEKKSPGLAAVISALVPGSGFFYIGNYIKGFSYMLLFVLLIVLIVHSSIDGRYSMVTEIVVFSLLLAGFYIFQIIDCFNEAVIKREGSKSDDEDRSSSDFSLTGSIILIILGILFQLRNLDIIDFRDIIKLWPLLIIGIGLKMVVEYIMEKGGKDE